MSEEADRLRWHAARARRNVLRMLESHPSGHLGGALSAIDVITAVYFHAMERIPEESGGPGDRFLLSAGHKAMAQYAVLAEAGVVPESVLDTYGALDSPVPGHPDMHRLPGIEANTGALGHGLPIACGMAMGARLAGRQSRVFVLLGDGELPEGSNWEGAAMAAHHGLDNLVAVVDLNGLQISGRTSEVLDMEPVGEKFRSFGWSVCEIEGNDMDQVVPALDACPLKTGRPSVILARTVKGQGVSAVQGTAASHYWSPDAGQLASAVEEAQDAVDRARARLTLVEETR